MAISKNMLADLSKEEGINKESRQSITTPNPGPLIGK